MIRLPAFILFLLALSCATARSAEPVLETRVDDVVQQWMTDYKIQDAEVAVAQGGRLLGSFGHGWKDNEKQVLGSLSKAITGLCVAGLIDQNKLHMSDTIGGLIPGITPKDPRFNTITVEQLLTHRAGLTKNAFDDANNKTMDDAFATAQQTVLDNDPGTAPVYSDTGYLILGILIQKVTKQPYNQACAHVFTDAGLAKNAGVIDPTLVVRSPNGGWAISAMDYAKMLSSLDPKAGKLGKASTAWLQGLNDEKAYAKGGPCSRFKPKASYGFGYCRQVTDFGIRYYHDGLLHHNRYYPKTGGSFFYVNEAGVAAVVIFSGENGGDAYKALETGVINAMPAQ